MAVSTFTQTTLRNVPSVKANETIPMMPETRKKGEVGELDETTTPMLNLVKEDVDRPRHHNEAQDNCSRYANLPFVLTSSCLLQCFDCEGLNQIPKASANLNLRQHKLDDKANKRD